MFQRRIGDEQKPPKAEPFTIPNIDGVVKKLDAAQEAQIIKERQGLMTDIRERLRNALTPDVCRCGDW